MDNQRIKYVIIGEMHHLYFGWSNNIRAGFWHRWCWRIQVDSKKHVDAKKGQGMFGKQQLVPWVGTHGSWKGPKYKPHLKTNKKH